MIKRISIAFYIAFFIGLIFAVIFAAWGRDLDGRYANSPLKSWFEGLKNSNGAICCAIADGIPDPEWDSKDGHYRVKVDGIWMEVPDSAVVHEPNRFQRSMVWFSRIDGRVVAIRCFMPGTLT